MQLRYTEKVSSRKFCYWKLRKHNFPRQNFINAKFCSIILSDIPVNSLFYSSTSEKLKALPAYRELFDSLQQNDHPLHLLGVRGGLFPFLLAKISERRGKMMLVVMPAEQEVELLAHDLRQLNRRVTTLPGWGTVPYKDIPAHSPIFGARLRGMEDLLNRSTDILCTSLRSFLTPVPPPEHIRSQYLRITQKQDIETDMLITQLDSRGYTRVKRVSAPGEFALRGEVCDLFMPGDEYPLRMILNWNSIGEIRRFDHFSQSSIENLKEFMLRPAKEMIWDEDGSLCAYLSEGDITVIGEYERCLSAAEGLRHEYDVLYRRMRRSEASAMPLLFSLHEREQTCPALLRFLLLNKGLPAEAPAPLKEIHFHSDESRSFFGNIQFFRDEIKNLEAAGYTVFLLTDSEVQKNRLERLFRDLSLRIVTGGISTGFSIPESSFMIIHENELFGRKRRTPQSIRKVQSEAIDSFVELDEKDYVVHVNHGIGRFIAIQRIQAGGNERDYIKLEFADEEFVFVPIEQVNLVQRYIGSSGNAPRLDRIGGKSWEKRKSRVSRHVEDLAEHLLDIYSKRQKITGYAFPPDSEWQIEFEAAFPFEETEDQIRCIEEVKQDMERPLPMDRLVCGDVGYGKTEIAMRAAFKALSAGKQVAFLAPTTILVEQHYETIEERTKAFPLNIGMMSRLVAPAEQKKIIAGLADGTLDLAIGTHRLIQKDVVFKNLGLIIIDEEQRFGVKDKEHLKALKTSVDCLTLSATPIPRTLHMSLLKIRDMSLLKTPPHNRRPIETHVEPFSGEQAASAIRREIERGGQVFYLHNRIETLDNIQTFLQNLLPEISVEQAHGQMKPHDLEDIMHRFIHGAFEVLVTTTIIENGIDIPNVNTIIIGRADMYGISQLYQLRGRVGRSARLAYAYLFYPEKQSLSEIAMKRLQIISDNTELGSGFKIAMKDLEIRGAGNLLGRQQSGDIYSIGFDLYLKLLDQAIRRLSENTDELPEEIYLEMEYTGYIPDTYITDTMEKWNSISI